MPKYTEEQVERAKQADVQRFLEETEGFLFEGRGRFLKCRNPEQTQRPSSLSIDTHLNRIYYNAFTGNKPLSAIDWCTKVKDMDFQSAMKLVLGEDPQGKRIEKSKYERYTAQGKNEIDVPKNLELSPASDNSKNVIAYLTKTRCIPANIVFDCLNQKLIYQDEKRNAVFVGYDGKTPKYAARRGTFTPDGKEPFKRDCSGSDKNFAFRLEGRNTEIVYVAEAAIDALSLAALEDKFNGKGAYQEKTYLSTGGAGIDNALEQFCKTHKVRTINICFDNDEAGKNGMEKIMKKYREKGYIVNDMRASRAHDYNDELTAFEKDPNFYSKPPDVVSVVNMRTEIKIMNERTDSMPEQALDNRNPQQPLRNEENIDNIPFDGYSEQNIPPFYDNINNLTPPPPPYPYEQPYYEYEPQENQYIPPQNEQRQPELTGLFSIEKGGEKHFYKTDKTANELLHTSANSEKPFTEMMNQGKKISGTEYAEIEQSSRLKFSVDIDLDNNTAGIYAVNNGRGGIAESERNNGNTITRNANLSAFAEKRRERIVPETNAVAADDMRRFPKSVNPEQTAPVKPEMTAVKYEKAEEKPAPVPVQKQKEKTEKSLPVMEEQLFTEEKPFKEEKTQTMDTNQKVNALVASLKNQQEKKKANLLDKIDGIDAKIATRQERISKLNSKITNLETSLKTLSALKRAFGDTVVGNMLGNSIEKKQAKIKEIREVKIPKHESDILPRL